MKIATAIVTILLATPAAATNLVANGSFETNFTANWSVSAGPLGRTTVIFDDVLFPTDGSWYFLVLDAGSLTQTLQTLPGKSYLISYDYGTFGGIFPDPNDRNLTIENMLTVGFGSTILESGIVSAQPMTRRSFRVTATDSQSLLSFSFAPVSTTGLDNVVVSQVPEPASWAMLITGFGLVGAAARRGRALVRTV